MTQTVITNRREFDRYSFQDTFLVEPENFQAISNTSSKNMSRKGAHLVSSTPLEIGAVVAIEIPSKRIQLMGEVRWVRPDGEGSYGIGVAFHNLFPSTGARIDEWVEEIQVQTESDPEGQTFSFELEDNVSSFLNSYIEAIKPEPIITAPVSYRRLGTPMENSYSFFTPSRPLASEGTTTSFRIDEPKVAREIPVRAISLSLLALSLFFFRTPFANHLSAWLKTPSTKVSATTATAPTVVSSSKVIIPSSSPVNANDEFVTFNEGPIEKMSWSGQADRFEIKINFRADMTNTIAAVSKINFDERNRVLVVVPNMEGPVDTKPIMVGHSLINQIRLGLHSDAGSQKLHIVMDMTSQNVKIASQAQTGQTLTLRLEYAAK